MFAAVYFLSDKKIEVVNVKKIKKSKGISDGAKFEISQEVFVTYKTLELDDAGKERNVDQDYKGIIAYLNKDRSEVTKFLEENEGHVGTALQSDNIPELIRKFEESKTTAPGPSKRKIKKTEKMRSLMEESIEVVEENTTSLHTSKNNVEMVEVTSSASTPKKKKKVEVVVEVHANKDSPSKNTRAKVQSAATLTAETQRLQSLEYFKNKKKSDLLQQHAMQNLQSSEDHDVLPPLAKPAATRTFEILQPAAVETANSCSYVQYLQTDEHTTSGSWINEESLTSVSSAVGTGLGTLYGPASPGPSQASCHNCDSYREQISLLEKRVHSLEMENEKLKACTETSLLKELKKLVFRFNPEGIMVDSPEAGPSFERTRPTRAAEHTLVSATQMAEGPTEIEAPPSATTKTRPIKPTPTSSIQMVEGHGVFFEPGENKVKLVEGHGLQIDAVKLCGIRKTAKGNGSRIIRDLLSYFFDDDFLACHSATGQKSLKPGLPVEVTEPIKEYCAANYNMTSHVVNSIINRKCLDAKRKQNI